MADLIDQECTASYIKADSNFKIFNLQKEESQGKYYPVICLILNLLQRGNPTDLSSYLKTRYEYKSASEFLHLFSGETLNWGETIRGDDCNERYPAREFYKFILPEYFAEYPYMQQLMIPEAKISDIVPNARKVFEGQRVDFFCPSAKLVIEIDGSQHKTKEQRVLDEQRNEYLYVHGYHTVRIPTTDLQDSIKIRPYIEKIKVRIKEFSALFDQYERSYRKCINQKIDKEMELIATMRLQITLLHMCLNGMISLADNVWNISIKNHEVSGYEHAAIEDMFLWIENICCMAGIPFKRPFVVVEQKEELTRAKTSSIRIEMSVLKRGTPCNTNTGWVCVYNSWRQDIDYFVMHIARRINYNLYQEDSDGNNGEGQQEQFNSKRKALRFVLKNIFGFEEFRNGQERIVINALGGRDTIGVLPTGSGKSLCYQLAVLLQPCISFCVCPIKSLMLDQDLNLKRRGISRTAFLSSDLSDQERNQVQQSFSSGKYWLVFVSPERFQSTTFRKYLSDMTLKRQLKFAYAVLDEVHCVSEWGHDFRVSYLNLTKTIRHYCSGITMFGLTATASYNVLKNILIEFQMKNKRDVISTPSFTRTELYFEVIKIGVPNERMYKNDSLMVKVRKTSKYKELKRLLNYYVNIFRNLLHDEGNKSRCGIVFFPFVNGPFGCYGVSETLKEDFEADIRFYSGEEPKDYICPDKIFDDYKKQVQEDFKENKFTLLCATKAFGMGIDKPNVRYTIHHGIPSSLESLYQEAGRAGRDRQKATCTVIYNPEIDTVRKEVEDVLKAESTIEELQQIVQEHRFDGRDAIRQMVLMAGGMTTHDAEKMEIIKLLGGYAFPNARNVRIRADKGMHDALQETQKYLYHLSLIGVVADWTVDWKGNSVGVDFCDYSKESVFKYTEQYIRNYETDYELTKDLNYEKEIRSIEERGETLEINNNYIMVAFTVFWEWYYNNIIYSRKQALKNVLDACDSFTKESADDFKDKMEAYFRLGDISDKLGVVADEPREYKNWFKIINVDIIKKEKIGNILMGLNRFLESYQNNVGLNFISGLLNMMNQHFDDANGKERLFRALRTIATFKQADKEFIVQESARVVYEVGNEEVQEEFAEFFIANFPLEDTDRHIYNIQGDNYSLKSYIEKILATMIEEIEDTDYGKR